MAIGSCGLGLWGFRRLSSVADTLKELRRAGRIDCVGVSNFILDQHEARAAHLNLSIETLQPAYPTAVIAPLHYGTLDLCMRHGVTSLAWSPLAGGRMITGQNERAALFTVIDELATTSSQLLSWPEVYRIVAASEGRPLP
ncbi:MAG: aldo/keto reductase [Acidimicrobiaceae bacterium]|nr:aldo/keto reductase [Acidimicrobiaceae bacterium]